MRKRNDAVYLRHILDAVERIEQYTAGMTEQKFLQNSLVQDAVVRQLEIIGEASRNLSDELRQKHSQVPWAKVVGMRNRIVHAYFDVDLTIVWEVIQRDLPDLKAQVHLILQTLGGTHGEV
jgi:uncharacterized protein with HEPN domain